ncbi:Putative translation factor (SUA5) [Mycobacteroides abscessus subsp. abscessus]|nr:Putative translation factor (SUA5) [Mycobacteroides abscessus subsp. abscessus]
MGAPLISTTLIPQDETEPLNDAEQIRERFERQLAAVIDGGACPNQATTVIDLTDDQPVVVRIGRGDPASLGIQVD